MIIPRNIRLVCRRLYMPIPRRQSQAVHGIKNPVAVGIHPFDYLSSHRALLILMHYKAHESVDISAEAWHIAQNALEPKHMWVNEADSRTDIYHRE